MFTTLPDFTPRDSHSLWYRSSRSPYTPPGPLDDFGAEAQHQQHAGNQARQRGKLIERSALARLAADEQYMQRRRLNIQNYGSGWLKPPGVPKTLHQMREEKREQEEHQEAMRREQLAQELAEAEAEGMPEDGTMDDVQLDGAQDLDDEIPDADDGFGFGDDDDDDEDEDEDSEEEDDEQGEETEDESALREERQNDLMASRMRMNDDAFREALVRGEPDATDMYGDAEDLEEEDNGHLLDEDDFAQEGTDDGLGMDMDADLDDDIPEAENGGYEHTDSEAELTSSEEEEVDDDDDDDDDADVSFAPRSTTLPPPLSPTFHGRSSVSHPRASMDLSNLLSQDGSSFMASSPAGRRARHG
ncbi:Midasin [Fusarium albosuccineum]|uniref:Midasin n=1 Tax=Fusarium albosuccineum TaxID=1237068 RepID=A0A8H4P8N2_9HYPO|nr:Midasin [Fusarium albosuccineum]